MYQIEKANKDLKTILSQFKDSYRMICDSSRNSFMKTLSPGAPVPREGLIYGNDCLDEFESMCLGYRDRAKEIFDKLISELKDKVTQAPSSEAVNLISLLGVRKDVTKEEIDNLLEKYGDNPQTWKSLVSIAKENGINTYGENDLEVQLREIEDLSKSIEKTLSSSSAQGGHATDGFLAMLSAQIDNVLPIGE